MKIQLYRQPHHTFLALLLMGAAVFFVARNVHFEARPEEGAKVVEWHSEEELRLLVDIENGRFFEDREPQESYPALFSSGHEVKELPEGSKVCYLTFDDGPSENTPEILQILKEYDAHATFFLIGENITGETAPYVRQILAEGHAIGLHANVHKYKKLYRDIDSFLADYETLYIRLKDEFGVETALFRFPGGSACTYLHGQGKAFISQMRHRGFTCYDWNVSGEDAVGKPTVSSIKKNVFRNVFRYKTPVVLLHDSAQTSDTVTALPDILKRIAGEGYTFQSLAEADEYIFPKNR